MIFSDAGPDVRWCGNERGFSSLTSWCRIHPEGIAPGKVENLDRLPLGEPDGEVWRPAEVDVSMREGWFFHPGERPRSADELFHIWLSSVGRNAGLNLNLTPDQRGLIPEEDIAVLHRSAIAWRRLQPATSRQAAPLKPVPLRLAHRPPCSTVRARRTGRPPHPLRI